MAKSSAPRTLLVRVCTYDPKRGYTARTFVRDGDRITQKWREMTVARITQLKLMEARQENGIQPLFQICTREEALNLEATLTAVGRNDLLNARPSNARDLGIRSAAIKAEQDKVAAERTSDETIAMLAALSRDIEEKEQNEVAEESEANSTPPPAPKPRARTRARSKKV